MLCYAMLCYAMLCCAMLAMLCYAVLCCAVLCCAVLCCAVLCYAMLCYAMLYYDTSVCDAPCIIPPPVPRRRSIISSRARGAGGFSAFGRPACQRVSVRSSAEGRGRAGARRTSGTRSGMYWMLLRQDERRTARVLGYEAATCGGGETEACSRPWDALVADDATSSRPRCSSATRARRGGKSARRWRRPSAG